jgi:acetyl-CoA carboxylase biotin carboxyl carrier protein
MRVPAFDADAVRALAAILTETGLTEIEIEGKEGRVRVARAPATVVAPIAAPVAGPTPAPVSAPAVVADDAAHPGAVRCPMVGVAYLSPEPGSPPYVAAGQNVVAGQTLLLIEAMKTFNQIKAPRAGTVTRLLVASGTPVEYDQPLLIIE